MEIRYSGEGEYNIVFFKLKSTHAPKNNIFLPLYSEETYTHCTYIILYRTPFFIWICYVCMQKIKRESHAYTILPSKIFTRCIMI